MPALQTFIDDPLRVLRVIRFATRLGYTLHQDILDSVKNDQIQSSFTKKITRERIGVEVDKMIQGPDPVRALELIHQFGFFPLVFSTPEPISVDAVDARSSIQYCKMVHSALEKKLLGFEWSAKDIRFLYLATTIHPFNGHYVKVKTRSVPVGKHVILVSLKVFVSFIDHTAFQ